MKLFENPIFITQKRLVHRAGVMPLILAALLIGVSMIGALYYHLQFEKWDTNRYHESPTDLGTTCYGWVLALQALALVVGGFSRISRTLVEERKAGLLDINRLSPLTGAELALGYWFGAALREFYVAAVLSPVGLVIVLMTRLSLEMWLGTQLLLLATGLFFGLLAILGGMAMPRAQGGLGAVAVVLIVLPVTIMATRFSLTNLLVPIYPTVHMFHPTGADSARWESPVGFYGVTLPPLVYTLALQAIFGCLAWRGAVRKFGNPNRPGFSRAEQLLLYGLLVLFQYGLIWEWRQSLSDPDWAGRCAVYGCVLFFGVMVLVPQLLHPEEARIRAMQLGAGAYRRVLWASGPCMALGLAAIACGGLLTQRALGLRYFMAVANILVVLLTFSMLLEICRLLFRSRAIGFFALALFILYGLPFLLSLTFMSETPLKFSMISPGIAAIGEQDADDLRDFYIATVIHLGIVAVLAWVWANCWRRWLERRTVLAKA